jgi:hypothetical protein
MAVDVHVYCLHEPNPFRNGRLAQSNRAPALSGARLVGKSAHVFTLAEGMIPRSNAQALLDDLKNFFRDNPAWK